MNNILKLTAENQSELAEKAADIIRRGGVVLVPTETVYGLVGKFNDEAVRNEIFRLKKREKSKRLGIFIGDWQKLSDYGVLLDGLPERLARKYCPGAITIIAPCTDGSTLGFRVPDHPFVLELLKKVDFPLYNTSANASGEVNILKVETALEQLDGNLPLLIDGGEIPADSLASTVVDATGDKLKILRQGALQLEMD